MAGAQAARRLVVDLEVMDRDLRVLKVFGHLTSDPAAVSRDEVGDALGSLLDGLAKRFGVFGAGADTPAKGSAKSAPFRGMGGVMRDARSAPGRVIPPLPTPLPEGLSTRALICAYATDVLATYPERAFEDVASACRTMMKAGG
jgi:hypothetical protein